MGILLMRLTLIRRITDRPTRAVGTIHDRRLPWAARAFAIALALTSIGCASFPQLPDAPLNSPDAQTATFRLMRTNKNQYGMGGCSGLAFGDDYGVKIRKDWEDFNWAFLASDAQKKFNDKAVFTVPAGTYDVTLVANAPVWNGIKGLTSTLPGITVKPGAKYEVWATYAYSESPSGGMIELSLRMRLDKIIEVSEFRDNPFDP